MVSQTMLYSIVQFLVVFAVAASAEGPNQSSQRARNLQARHFTAPVRVDMPSNQNAVAQSVSSPTPAPSGFEQLLPPSLEPTSAPTVEPTPSPASTVKPTPSPTMESTVSRVANPDGAEVTNVGGGGTATPQNTRGGFGAGAGTALGAGLFVLLGGVVFLRRRKLVDGDATAQPMETPVDEEDGTRVML